MTDIGSKGPSRSAAVIVAHPDDETLWAGGTILNETSWSWFILTLCRAGDPDRAPRFFQALTAFGAQGAMSDLDDGPDQRSLEEDEVQDTILEFLPHRHFDIVISHSPAGEYTRHRRHEEAGRAVTKLWHAGKISAGELWLFAYEDGGKQYLPRPIRSASIYRVLPEQIWKRKYLLITETYGFDKNGFEAKTTPRAEAFWQFTDPGSARQWLDRQVVKHENTTAV